MAGVRVLLPSVLMTREQWVLHEHLSAAWAACLERLTVLNATSPAAVPIVVTDPVRGAAAPPGDDAGSTMGGFGPVRSAASRGTEPYPTAPGGSSGAASGLVEPVAIGGLGS